ncbi:MAG: gliding motility-associated C-terminal domain-containing protein [Flavobacteriales bacterium]|nr:gliding motility-associated C-terminal domain-containing protein [Flavobacteriales bacterium]
MKYALLTLFLLFSIIGFNQIVAPVAAFSATDSTICPAECVDFTDLSTSSAAGIASWSWDFGNGQTSNLPNPTGVCYALAGTYIVLLTVTDANGFDTDIQVNFITVNASFCGVPPVVDFSASDSAFCIGTCIDFTDLTITTASAGITNWDWNFGNGQTSNLQNPTGICYNSTGFYTVTLAVTDANGFDNEIEINFLFVSACNGPLTSFISDDVTVCPGECVNYTDVTTTIAPGGVLSWEWSFPGGSPADHIGQFPPTICYATAGSYDVELVTVDADGPDTLSQAGLVTVFVPIPIPISVDTSINIGDTATLSTGAGFSNYLWSPPDSIGCITCQNTIAYPVVTTTYLVTADDANGCPVSDSVVVTVIIPPDTLLLPNIFTPNNDGVNDQFRITAPEGFTLEIYNRWGELIYHSGLQPYWDGRTNSGEIALTGTYFYVVKLVSGEAHTGMVTLQR